MKQIKKGMQPASLIRHCSQPSASYENYSEKAELRQALLEEQGYICCYCMGRISSDEKSRKMKIEHWASQSKYPSKQLDYGNLLGACLGNEGARPKKQHCDTRKGDHDIQINPADKTKSCEQLIRYRSSGELYSDNPDVDQDINETLNLNIAALTRARSDALLTVVEKLNQAFPRKTWPSAAIRRELDQIESLHCGRYLPFCQYVATYLRRRL